MNFSLTRWLASPHRHARRQISGETKSGKSAVTWCGLLVALLVPSQLLAVPAFSRRYETSCPTCHMAFPRLNAVGESFRLNGYRFVSDEQYRKIQPVELGDEAYKRLWPRALWPSDVPRTSPLSLINRLMGEGDLDGSRRQPVTFLFPEEIESVWVANLGQNISLYGDVIFLQKDFGGEKAKSWATLKGWIQFQDLVGERTLNLRAGTVGTQSLGLFTARDANFYGTHYYLYTSWIMPRPKPEASGLGDFKGNNFSIGPQPGIEVNGFGKHWFYAAGVVNGDPATSAVEPPESAISFMGSGDGGATDYYLQLAWKIGGAPFDRSGEAQAQTLTPGAEFWRDNATTLSLFGYRGRATIRTTSADGRVDEYDDPFWRFGAGVQQQIRDLTVGAAWVQGRNERPYGSLSEESVASRTWHVETIVAVYPWLFPYARYESRALDVPRGIPGLSPEQDIGRLLVGGKAMIRPNVALTSEAALYRKGAELEEGIDGTLFVLLSVAF